MNTHSHIYKAYKKDRNDAIIYSKMENLTECNANTSDLVDPIESTYCEVPNEVMTIQAIFLAAVTICSCIGNIFILSLVIKYKTLRYRSILVCLSLVVCDLFLVVFFHLPALLSVCYHQWILGYIGCQLFGYVGFYFIHVRWMSMAVISLDRFSFIFFPLSYPRWSKPYLIFLTIASWVIPILLTFPSLVFGKRRYTFRPGFFHCIVDCGEDKICYGMYDALLTLQLLLGAGLPSILYTIIYCYSRRKRNLIQMGSHDDLTVEGNLHIQSYWSKRDTRALITILLLLIALLLSSLPIYLLIYTRRVFTEFYQSVPIWVQMIVMDSFQISTLLDPLLIIRNRDIYEAIKMTINRSQQRSRNKSTLRRSSVLSKTINTTIAIKINRKKETTKPVN